MTVVGLDDSHSDVRAGYRTLREIVRNRLLEDILQARLKPGQKLIETELARAYGVSRGPVREAILALEGQGFVCLLPNHSAVVSSLTKDELREVYDIRAELDGLAARLGVVGIGSVELAAMEHLLTKMDGCERSGETEAWLSLNDKFHLTLFRASGRERLCGLITELMRTIQPYARTFIELPGRLTETHADHRLILDAVRERDADRVAALTKEHLGRAADIVVAMVAADIDTSAAAREIATRP